MPISKEKKKLYPANWKEISANIRRRADNRCEFCGVINHAHIKRVPYGWECCLPDEEGAVWIVLTVAHLDHNPRNCDPSNLKALCQKCHLTYDAKHHATNARKTRDAKYGILSLGFG
jgi:hypothetical protein